MARAEPDGKPATGLGFVLRPAARGGTLALPAQELFTWLRVEQLVLDIPPLGEPLAPDTPIERFQRRRTHVRSAVFHLSDHGLHRLMEQRMLLLVPLGVEELTLQCRHGWVAFTGRVRDGSHAADVSFRVHLVGEGAAVRVLMDRPRIFGHLPTPAPLLAHRILIALAGAPDPVIEPAAGSTPPRHGAPGEGQTAAEEAGASTRPRVLGLGQLVIEPLHAFLWTTLPAAGWRLPGTSQVALVRARIGDGRVEIAFEPVDPPAPQEEDGPVTPSPASPVVSSEQAARLDPDLLRMREGDDALRAGNVDAALSAYRGRYATDGPASTALERLLAVCAAQPARFEEGSALARELLARDPDLEAAHAALAGIAMARGHTREAAASFARLAAAAGDEDAATCAALAGARILRRLEPAAATPLYEQVLAHRPGHAEAIRVLVERYADEKRWPALAEVLRARIADAATPAQELRDRVQRALILRAHLDDAGAAREEIGHALDIDPDHLPALEIEAELALAAGDEPAALTALRRLAMRSADRGNAAAAAGAWTRAGQVHERRGEDQEAETCYRQALVLAPAEPAALRGAATMAGRRGDHAAAAQMWTRLTQMHGHAPAAEALYRLELGRSLLASGNDGAAEEALRQATPQGVDAIAAEAHCLLADMRRARQDPRGAAAELDAAIVSLSRAADRYFAEAHSRGQDAAPATPGQPADPARPAAAAVPAGDGDDQETGPRYLTRAAHLSRERALLLEELGRADAARADYHRAHALARKVDAVTAREQARSLIRPDRVRGSVEAQRRWIDALLKGGATGGERVELLLARAELRCRGLLDGPAEGAGNDMGQDPGLEPADIQDALQDLDEVLAAGPSSVQRALALVLQAQLRGAAGDAAGRARALAERATLVVAALGRAEAEAEAARAWLVAGDDAAALSALQRALAQIERMPAGRSPAAVRRRILALLADTAWRRQSWDVLLHTCEPLAGDAAVPPAERARHTHRLGMAREARGDLAGAVRAFEAALAVTDVTGEQRTESWRALARTREHAGEIREAAGIFEMLARDQAAAATSRDRADAWHRAGDLWRRQGNADEAERCFEAALHHAPDHLPSLDALESLVRARGDDHQIAAILRRKVAATKGHPERQRALLLRLAELQATRLDQRDAAADTYRRVLELDPSCRPAQAFVAAAERDAGNLVAAAEAYERLAYPLPGEVVPGADKDAALLEKRVSAAKALVALAARAGADVLARDRVRTVLAELHAIAPEHPVLQSLRATLGEDAGAAPARAARPVTDTPAPAGPAPAEDNEDTLRERADAAAAAGDHEEYARCLRALALCIPAGTPTGRLRNRARRAEVLLELADLYYDRLGDRERARQAMREAAEAYGPGSRHDATLRMLATEAAADGADADAVAAYEAIEPARRTAADYLGMATSYQRMGRNARAIAVLEQAQEVALLSDRGAVLLFGLSQERRVQAEQAATLEAGARQAEAAGAARRLREALEIYEQALEDRDAAARVRQALAALGETAPDEDAAGPAHRAGAANRADAGAADHPGDEPRPEDETRPRTPADTAEYEIPARSAAARRRKRFEGTRLGVVPAGGRTQPMPGASLPPAARAAAPRPVPVPVPVPAAPKLVIPAAAEQLTNPLRRHELPAQPPGAQVTQPITPRMLAPAQAADPQQRPLRTTQLGYSPHRNSRATLTYPGVELDIRKLENAAVTTQDPARAAELLGRSLTLRTGRLSRHGQPLDDDALAVLGRLRDVARRSGQLRVLAQALEATAAVAGPEVKGGLLHEAGCLERDALGNHSAAANLLMRALEAMPASTALLRDVDALLRQRGDGRRLVEAYELHLGTLDGAARARPLYELGRLYRDALNEPGLAASYFARAFQADPDLVDVWLPLANARFGADDMTGARQLYERILERGAPDPDSREWILSRLAAMSDGPGPRTPRATAGRTPGPAAGRPGTRAPGTDPRIDEALRRAAALETRGQADAALPHYRGAAARAPGDPRPIEALERLYRAQGKLGVLAEVLGELTQESDDPRVRAALWFRRARIFRDELHQEPEAYQCLKRAHAEDPGDSIIANALRHIAMARGEWALAASLLRREIETATSTREAGALNLELALIYDEKLLDAEQARIHYEQALALDPAIPAVPRPLARLYELAGRHADAARMNEIAAQHARDDSQRSRLLYRAAVSAERARDPGNARRLYHLAALAAPEGEDASASQRALLRLGDDSGTTRTQILELALRDATSDAQRIELLRQLLDRATVAGDLDAAGRHARALLRVDGADLAAYLVLKSRAEATKDWSALASLLNARAVSLAEPGERAAVYYDLGRLHQVHLQDPAAAADAFEKALVADPSHPAALEALADLAYQRQDWERARQLYARMRPETTSLSADAIAYRRGVIAEALGREREALESFTQAVALLPSHKDALTALCRLALRAGDLDQAIEASRALLDLVPADEVQAITGARLRLAELCAQAGQVDAAIEYNELVLSEEPSAQPALRALVELHVRRGDFDSAARVLRRLIAATPLPAQRTALLYRLGEMHRIHLGDPEQAADAYLKGIDLDPTHVPTLRRLLDHYWREDDPVELLEIVDALAEQDALLDEQTGAGPLIRALVVVAAEGNTQLTRQLVDWLDDQLSEDLADVLAEALGRQSGALSIPALASAVTLICELAPSVRATDLAARLAPLGTAAQALIEALGTPPPAT